MTDKSKELTHDLAVAIGQIRGRYSDVNDADFFKVFGLFAHATALALSNDEMALVPIPIKSIDKVYSFWLKDVENERTNPSQ